MKISRRTFLLAAAAAACSRRADSGPLDKAVDYLWAQQSGDGGFHSTTYGLLRSGQSLTPFVLNAMLSLPDWTARAKPAALNRALEFLKRNTGEDGEIGTMDQIAADYPNYATALTVTAMIKAGHSGSNSNIERMTRHLLAQQFSEANDWRREDAPYGAWGMGGPVHRRPDAGQVDLSMTRCVLEALQAAGVSKSDPAVARALVYLKRSQNPDGGFFFSAVNPEINKAGAEEGSFKSYGTATGDGVLALRAAGIADTDDRIVRALGWLKDHHRSDHAPGFEGTARESWGAGLRFYYAYVISLAMPDLPIMLPPQDADGGFRNSNKMVKEDDPLIATACALYVLGKTKSPV
jgi:squalene-hopene/tetraprenyl-beta-curcumene cyclase